MRAGIMTVVAVAMISACSAPSTGQQPPAQTQAPTAVASPVGSPTATRSPGTSPVTATPAGVSPGGSPAPGSPAIGRTPAPTVPVAQVQPTPPPGAGGVEIVIETVQRQGPLGLVLALLVAAAIVLTLSWALRRR